MRQPKEVERYAHLNPSMSPDAVVRLLWERGEDSGSGLNAEFGADPSDAIFALESEGIVSFTVNNGSKTWYLTKKGYEEASKIAEQADWGEGKALHPAALREG